MVKVVCTKTIERDGETTNFEIELDLKNPDSYELRDVLENLGYYKRNFPQRVVRFLSGH